MALSSVPKIPPRSGRVSKTLIEIEANSGNSAQSGDQNSLGSFKALKLQSFREDFWCPEIKTQGRHSDIAVAPRGMHPSMATDTQRNQVFLGIVAGVTAKPLVVNFEVRHRFARLKRRAIRISDQS